MLKNCPKCSNSISDKDKFCPNCGCALEDVNSNSERQNKVDEVNTLEKYENSLIDENECKVIDVDSKKEEKIYTRNWFVIVMLIFVPPVGIFLMWKYNEFILPLKITLSVICCISFLFWGVVFIALIIPCKHDWERATCENPIRCVICGETEGKALGHKWVDATCIKPKTCKVCNSVEGKALGHDTKEWSEWDEDYNKAIIVREKICKICEEVVKSESKEITSFIDGDHFKIYPYGFADRFDEQSKRLEGIEFSSKKEYNENASFFDENNTLFYRIQDNNDNDIGMYSFNKPNGKSVPRSDNFDDSCIACINILVENSYNMAAVIYSTILTIDPSIGYSEAAEVGQKVQDSLVVGVDEDDIDISKGIKHNGINYFAYKSGRYHYLIVSIAKK